MVHPAARGHCPAPVNLTGKLGFWLGTSAEAKEEQGGKLSGLLKGIPGIERSRQCRWFQEEAATRMIVDSRTLPHPGCMRVSYQRQSHSLFLASVVFCRLHGGFVPTAVLRSGTKIKGFAVMI